MDSRFWRLFIQLRMISQGMDIPEVLTYLYVMFFGTSLQKLKTLTMPQLKAVYLLLHGAHYSGKSKQALVRKIYRDLPASSEQTIRGNVINMSHEDIVGIVVAFHPGYGTFGKPKDWLSRKVTDDFQQLRLMIGL